MPPWVPEAIGVLLIALDVYAAGRAILRKSGVAVTLAWLLAIIAFPFVGALVYLFFASPSIRRATRRHGPTRRGTFAERSALEREATGEESAVPEAARAVVALSTELTGLPPTAGNQVRLLTSGGDAFQVIEAAVSAARARVWAEYYIIKNDATGHRFLELLARKAAEGIEVRLLYDAVGSLRLDPRRLRAIEQAGGSTAVFLPVNPFRRRWSTHLRNHRKLVLVDDAVGFTGGMNVGDEYSGFGRRTGGQHFEDSHLELRGPAVADLAEIFVEDWGYATEEVLEPPQPAPPVGRSLTAVVPSGPDQRLNAHGMVYFTGIAAARSRVYIASPYFVPDPPTIRALCTAALRGVDVRLIVPRTNDVAVVGWAARSYYAELVACGVGVHEFLPSMLHAKRMVVDGVWGIVGSANVDIRSFRLNFELGALIVDPDFAVELEAQFFAELGQSEAITAEMLSRVPLRRRLRDAVARLFSPLL